MNGIGTDIVEIETIKQSILKSARFLERIYTDKERRYCESQVNKYQHYAARFAAKEAMMKAMGTGWNKGVQFYHVEIYNNKEGKPFIKLYKKAKEIEKTKNIIQIQLSLSHTEHYAIAFVITK